jgi:hypothetical protein
MRVLGVALMLYGVLGLLLAGAGTAVGVGTAARVTHLVENVDGSLAAAASTVQSTAHSLDGFETSLSEADAAARSAAGIARDASVTMANLSAAMSLTVFGAQPLLPLARDFQRSSEQLVTLSRDLDRVGLALGANIEDLASIRDDLRDLGRRLDAASAGGGARVTRDGAFPLQALFVGAMAWIALQALGALVAGVLVLRRGLRHSEPVVVDV